MSSSYPPTQSILVFKWNVILGSHIGFPLIASVPQESIRIPKNQTRCSASKSASEKTESAFWRTDWIKNSFARMRHIRRSSISLYLHQSVDLERASSPSNPKSYLTVTSIFCTRSWTPNTQIGLLAVNLDLQQSNMFFFKSESEWHLHVITQVHISAVNSEIWQVI